MGKGRGGERERSGGEGRERGSGWMVHREVKAEGQRSRRNRHEDPFGRAGTEKREKDAQELEERGRFLRKFDAK